MTTRLLICDDSRMARRQLERALPESWDVEITTACDGREGFEVIRSGGADVVLLDLTMPVLDGYGVLRAVQEAGLESIIIVVTGDVQPQARELCLSLGAVDYVKKPVDSAKMHDVLHRSGLI